MALMRPFFVFLVLLVPAAALAAGTGEVKYVSETALQHYAYGRLLEESGDHAAALEEYYHALMLEPRAVDIIRRVSEVASMTGDAGRSLEFAEKALAIDPGDVRSRWLQGTALLNLGRDKEALAPLQAATGADSERVEYFRTLGRAAERLEMWDLMADTWRRVVWLDEEDGEAWFQLAAAETRRGNFGAADSALQTASANNPLRPGLFLLQGWIAEGRGQPAAAIEAYRQHLQIHASDQATRRRLVMLLAREKRYAEAAAEAKVVAHARPSDVDARQVEAELLFEAGAATEATQRLEDLKRDLPNDPEAINAYVSLLSRHGKGKLAVAEAERWLARHPADLQAQLLAARAHSSNGELKEAVTRLRQAIAAAPDSIAPRAILARAYESAKRFPDAERVWREAAERFPASDALGYDLALCREKMADLAGAEHAVRDVLARQPKNATALNFLGYLFADHNLKLAEAVDLIQQALAIDPDNGAYLDSLGWAYYRLGRLDEARAQLEKALRMSGGDPTIHEHLGDVYKDLRLNQLAKDQYLKSLSYDQTNDRVKTKLSRIR